MTATERLRALLTERGVEYETYIEPQTGFEHVKWNFNEHGSADFNIEFGEPWLTMYGAISGPEQAIAATLGPKVTGNASDGYHTFNELDQAPEWDGHTPSEAIERIATLGSCNCSNDCTSGERVVRCRDCESATDHCEGMDVYWCEYLSRYVGADTFCAWGVRKEGE